AKIKALDKNGRKGIIAKKAAHLFRKKGYPNASMRELAESLHIEAPSLYNHFTSKGEILEMICAGVALGYVKNINEIAGSTKSYALQLESLIRYHIRIMISEFDEQYVAGHEWKHLPPAAFKSYLEERKNYEKKMTSIIEAGIKRNEFVKVDAGVAVLTILSAVRGLEAWHRNKKSVSGTILENDMTKLLLNGLIK
ncbi:MAG: TetR/AcrR family transcriptional regulator, partial [Chitinophagaceae bacterium]